MENLTLKALHTYVFPRADAPPSRVPYAIPQLYYTVAGQNGESCSIYIYAVSTVAAGDVPFMSSGSMVGSGETPGGSQCRIW